VLVIAFEFMKSKLA